ncbi:MAG: HlyD family secretion protein, partial [Planctomycetales bacterium]
MLTCLVEGEAGTGILKIVDEGTRVVKDQVLVELDSSRLRNDSTSQQIVVEQAEAGMKNAEKNVEIQKTQNESDISAAELKLELAILDLEKYEQGDYIQELNTIKGEIQLASEDVTRYDEKYTYTQRLIKKGYATQSELEADRIAKDKAKIALAVAKEKMEVLEKYSRKRQMAEKEANAKEYERELARVKLKAAAALTQQEADYRAKSLTYQVEKEKYDKLQRQIQMCIIKAPRDGLVVYANTRTGFRGGSEPLIYEGAKVKERQAIINLPDVTNMQVNARIHESKIDMVREQLPATIRVDALPGETFHGVVNMVSLVPMSG